jgi:capsular polysaccharide transport system ATP-binding protein
MIRLEGIWKRYHTFGATDWVLRDIDLVIPTGVSVGLVGRNGAGKSTLLNLIGGIDSPERGRVVRDCRVSWPIGLTGGFQPTMTGRQNVAFVARIHGGADSAEEVMQRVIDFAEIGSAIDRPIKTYSAGMKARLNFGMSLAFDFDVYLSDEATAVGDVVFRQKAAKAFKDRVGRASLIIVSHQENILRELCQAGIVLDGGGATWFDDIGEALSVYRGAQIPPHTQAGPVSGPQSGPQSGPKSAQASREGIEA